METGCSARCCSSCPPRLLRPPTPDVSPKAVEDARDRIRAILSGFLDDPRGTLVVQAGCGTGKTSAVAGLVPEWAREHEGKRVLWVEPTHLLYKEVRRYIPDYLQIQGAERACLRGYEDEIWMAMEKGLPVRTIYCPGCPQRGDCSYMSADREGAPVCFATFSALQSGLVHPDEYDLVVVDEVPPMAAVIRSQLTLADLRDLAAVLRGLKVAGAADLGRLADALQAAVSGCKGTLRGSQVFRRLVESGWDGDFLRADLEVIESNWDGLLDGLYAGSSRLDPSSRPARPSACTWRGTSSARPRPTARTTTAP